MKRFLAALLIVCATTGAAPAFAQSVGSTAPDFTISNGVNLNGKTKLSDWRGSWVEVDIFRTW